MYNLIKNKRTIKDKIKELSSNFSSSKVFRPKNITRFVFLCGANKDKDNISERRKALIEFSQRKLPHTHFFLAESMFSVLQEEGHKGNILDVEHEISEFADNIVIVLESPSAYAELGAFSHRTLRDKLIVINDSRFLKSKSFINLGPIKAITEATSNKNILNYKMRSDGIHKTDSIGKIYSQLYELLKEPLKGKTSPITINSCNPSLKFNKNSIMFIHDLIYFTGPLLHKEIIEILILLFGKQNFKLKQHVALLSAFGTITRNKEGLFRSNLGDTFYEYRFDKNDLISTFRNYTLKYHPNRIYEY